MCMASATIIKYPDGRTESKNILTSFEKNGTSIIVFETDKVDNGHKVVGVSYLSDGMYQNIVDANKWNEAKGYLVDILHDRMTENDYRLVPAEVLVTADPYHSLALRDENLDKMSADYEKFVAANQVVETVPEVQAETMVGQPEQISEVTSEEDIVADIPILNGAINVEETANVMDIVDEVIDPLANNQVTEQQASEIQPEVASIQESVMPEVSIEAQSEMINDQPVAVGEIPEVAVNDNNVPLPSNEPKMISPVIEAQPEVVNDQPVVVGEIPEVAPVVDVQPEVAPMQESVMPEVGVAPEVSTPVVEDIQPVIMENPVQDVASEPVNIEVNQVPIAPTLNESPALEPVLDIPQMPVDNTPIDIVPEANVENVVDNVISFPEPVVNETSVAPIVNEAPAISPDPIPAHEGSLVKDSYEKTAADIIQQMRELTEEYFKKMEEMRAEISRNLEEAKGINELSKQTFDRAQAMAPVQQNIEPVLELTKAA